MKIKPIKIIPENQEKIEDILTTANGKAWKHVYDRYSEIEDVVQEAEIWLGKRLPKKSWKGAKYEKQSGSMVAKAYRSTVNTTTVIVERRASGWFLIDARSSGLWPNAKPSSEMYLSQDQSDEYVSRIKTHYRVIVQATPAPAFPTVTVSNMTDSQRAV